MPDPRTIRVRIAVAVLALMFGCGPRPHRDVVFKQATFHQGGGVLGTGPYTVYEFEDGSKRVIEGIVRDIPPPGTVLRIEQ